LLGAAGAYWAIGDLLKARALARELMEFAEESGSARALSFAHLAAAQQASSTGDNERAVIEGQRARDAAVDPFYKALAEIWLAANLIVAGNIEGAKAVVEPALKFNEEHGFIAGVLAQRLNQAMILISEGELTKGMGQLVDLGQKSGALGATGLAYFAQACEAFVYAQIATGGGTSGSLGSTIGVMLRNPGFVLGHARKASQTARDLLAEMSENLPPVQAGSRFGVEFTLAKVLIKRKERDEARKHLEKVIAFLQPIGDCVGMRDARALLASLDAK
jgi:tetratricopeptide (TPR) repeat protein